MGSDADEKARTTHAAKLQEEARRGRVRWPVWLSIACTIPLIVAVALFATLTFATEAITTGPLTLLHARGESADLWLGFAGACARARGSVMACKLTPLNTYYANVYALVHLEELEDSLPSNLGFQATMLLAALVLGALAVLFVVWGAYDYRRAEKWQLAGLRGWVAEWLISRRLDILGTAFALGSLIFGVLSASSAAVSASSAVAAINVVAPKTAADFGDAEAGYAASALFAACGLLALACLVLLLVLAFDGLGHRIRRDYEDLVDDVEQLENEAWVSLEAKMHTLHELATRHAQAQALPDPQRRQRTKQALEAYLKSCDIDDLLDEMAEAVKRHRKEIVDYNAQVRQDDLGYVANDDILPTARLLTESPTDYSTESSVESRMTMSEARAPTTMRRPPPPSNPALHGADAPGLPPLPAGLADAVPSRPRGATPAAPARRGVLANNGARLDNAAPRPAVMTPLWTSMQRNSYGQAL